MKNNNVKKGLILAGIIIGVVMFSGCGKQMDKLKEVKKQASSLKKNSQELTEKSGGMISNLKEALKKGVSMKCVSQGKDSEWVTYINGKKMRSEGKQGGKEQIVLVTDGVSYMWEKGAKVGQKIDKKCLEDFEKQIETPTKTEEMMGHQDETIPKVEDLEVEEENGKVKCTVTTEADFSVPKDVNFTDQCQLMKQQMKNLKNDILKNIPKGQQ